MAKKSHSGIITLSVIALAAIAGFVFRQDIYDWNRLRNYTPSSEIVALADDTTLYDSSKRLFYVQHPTLADKSEFNEYCRDNEYTIVLGCYISGQGIYLLDVEDERLSGVEEVTAAHELLHAAYERLSDSEKQRINKLLASEYDKITETRLVETIEQYRSKDSKIVPNELHSIIGTEVRNISTELEQYYSRYFTNRTQIVGFSERYEQAFIERRNKIRQYDEQLEALKKEIESLQASLETQNAALVSQRNRMNSYRKNGNNQAYNDMVSNYNDKVQNYNQDVKVLESKVTTYNDLAQKRNSIAKEEAELVEAIDSRTAVPKQQ